MSGTAELFVAEIYCREQAYFSFEDRLPNKKNDVSLRPFTTRWTFDKVMYDKS